MTNSTPLVFFGSDQFSRAILESLLEAGYDIRLVVTTPAARRATRAQEQPPIAELADKRRLMAIRPDKLDDNTLLAIKETGAEYGVLASYGKLLPDAVLNCFKAIINVHPSLLPRWRGPSPIEAAILAGDDKTGVSLIKLISEMDAGPIYAQSEQALSGQETQAGLRQDLAAEGKELLVNHLPEILAGRLNPLPQDEQTASYCKLIKKADGEIDWTRPALQLERQIRAYQTWPQSRAKLFGRDAIIVEAAVQPGQMKPGQVLAENERILIGTSDDLLEVIRIKPAGRAAMAAAEFLRGLKD